MSHTATPPPATKRGSADPPQRCLLSRFVFGHGGAATLAGICEISIFHPFDTVSKRLMAHRERVVDPSSLSRTLRNVDEVIFKSLYAAQLQKSTAGGAGAASSSGVVSSSSPGFLRKVGHLYPGSFYAVAYKVSQRVFKFAGQPLIRDHLNQHYHHVFYPPGASAAVVSSAAGKGSRRHRYGPMLLEGTAGCLVGVTETVLLPIDRMKVLNQTNRAALQECNGLVSAAYRYGVRKLYAGAATTATRNAVGSFFLFGGTACTKEYVFHLEGRYHEATFLQNLAASTVGGVLGVVATSPMDVIKTRIQGQSWAESSSGIRMFVETCQKEGFSAFYKGITPKVMTSAPRLVFGYTMTQYFLQYLRPSQQKKQQQKG